MRVQAFSYVFHFSFLTLTSLSPSLQPDMPIKLSTSHAYTSELIPAKNWQAQYQNSSNVVLQ